MIVSEIKRLASEILGVGKNKIRIKPNETARLKSVFTREDIRALIRDRIISVRKKVGFKILCKRKRKLAGSRRGTANARMPKKKKWMMNIRVQRKYLSDLVLEGNLDKKHKRYIYMKIKGGAFKGKRAMLLYLKENELYKESNGRIEEKKNDEQIINKE